LTFSAISGAKIYKTLFVNNRNLASACFL